MESYRDYTCPTCMNGDDCERHQPRITPSEFYRYDDIQYEDGVRVHLTILRLMRETPCGYWIANPNDWKRKDRWVSKTSRKRFAYPTKIEALKSFMARKRRQIAIYNYRLTRADEALVLGEDLLEKEENNVQGL